ncbi:MAG: translation elongation factor Ts [Deltaproteobacteria bacterium]|nr:translation elongation factor Ts [Candidatus Anaeroferrophillus wilburensis]MBN2888050.1 translation elongation factor Ts [Deltaproteobacteria bacterium]
MAEITAAMVKELREKTGAGIMDCKRALKEKEGNLEEALDFLREKGLAAASKKSGRITSEGLVGSYIHAGGKIGVLVEVNCETDFVARTDEFQAFVKDICMQIAAANPAGVLREDIPAEIVEREKQIFKTQALDSGKPENIVDKIVTGKLEKFYQENCLMEQPFVKDTDLTVEALVKDMIAKTGENISIRRFTRFVMGEGLEKRSSDLAQEVADQLK